MKYPDNGDRIAFRLREGHHYCHESKEYAIKTGYPGILQKARKMGLIK